MRGRGPEQVGHPHRHLGSVPTLERCAPGPGSVFALAAQAPQLLLSPRGMSAVKQNHWKTIMEREVQGGTRHRGSWILGLCPPGTPDFVLSGLGLIPPSAQPLPPSPVFPLTHHRGLGPLLAADSTTCPFAWLTLAQPEAVFIFSPGTLSTILLFQAYR